MKHRRPVAKWQSSESGWTWGRYQVVKLRPGSWSLDVDGTSTSTYRRATHAAAEANVVEVARRKRVTVIHNLVLVGLAAVALVAVQAGRTVPNTAYEPARRFVATLEDAYHSVEAGGITADSLEGTDGIAGAAFVAAVPFEYGGLSTEPRDRATIGHWSPRTVVIAMRSAGTRAGLRSPASSPETCRVRPRRR